MADTGRETSHTAVVRDHGSADRCAKRWRLASGDVTSKQGDLDVRAGGVFVEGIEKTGVRDFGFCKQRESSVFQGRKRLREEECRSQDQRVALLDGPLAYTE